MKHKSRPLDEKVHNWGVGIGVFLVGVGAVITALYAAGVRPF
ncbi:MAG: hypothetical protein V3S31_07755 [Dehalococcoidia bacterium]